MYGSKIPWVRFYGLTLGKGQAEFKLFLAPGIALIREASNAALGNCFFVRICFRVREAEP
jgi:hypothetical protein